MKWNKRFTALGLAVMLMGSGTAAALAQNQTQEWVDRQFAGQTSTAQAGEEEDAGKSDVQNEETSGKNENSTQMTSDERIQKLLNMQS